MYESFSKTLTCPTQVKKRYMPKISPGSSPGSSINSVNVNINISDVQKINIFVLVLVSSKLSLYMLEAISQILPKIIDVCYMRV